MRPPAKAVLPELTADELRKTIRALREMESQLPTGDAH